VSVTDERTMRAMVLAQWSGEPELLSVPIPSPGPGEVLVRVVACGAGLTLMNIRRGVLGGHTPRIMGHEFGGVIERLGEGVGAWEVGQRVTASFYLICGHCRSCRAGRDNLCEQMEGVLGAALDGAFAEFVVVRERNLVAVPDEVELAVAGVVSDAVATPFHAAHARARLVPGERVGVIGAGGGVGIHMVEMARAFGASVVAIERDAAKLARLAELGGLEAIVGAPAELSPAELVERAGGPLDAVFDTVGAPQTLRLGLSSLGRGGRLVIIGVHPGGVDGGESIEMIHGERAILGTRYASRSDIARALDLVAQGRVRVHIGARFPLERLGDAFAAIQGSEVFGRIVIDVAQG
jgi:D-arabinose 1-dehydrogenase-like Zn-dependent alcohol dehydrogenase